MKRRPPLSPQARAYAAFAGTVALALLAAAVLATPDLAVQPADILPLAPGQLEQMLPAGFSR